MWNAAYGRCGKLRNSCGHVEWVVDQSPSFRIFIPPFTFRIPQFRILHIAHCWRGILNRQSRTAEQNKISKLTVKLQIISTEHDCRMLLLLAKYHLYWQNMTYIGRTWLYWQNLTSIGRISFLPAEYDFHWQNMVYTGLLSLLLAEYAANQRCSAILLCSADSVYPHDVA